MPIYVINDTGYRLWLAGSEAIKQGESIFVVRDPGEPKRLPLEPDDISVSQNMIEAGRAALGQEGIEVLLTRIYRAMHAERSAEALGVSPKEERTDQPMDEPDASIVRQAFLESFFKVGMEMLSEWLRGTPPRSDSVVSTSGDPAQDSVLSKTSTSQKSDQALGDLDASQPDPG